MVCNQKSLKTANFKLIRKETAQLITLVLLSSLFFKVQVTKIFCGQCFSDNLQKQQKVGSFYNKIEDFCSELSKITLLSISPITETWIWEEPPTFPMGG